MNLKSNPIIQPYLLLATTLLVVGCTTSNHHAGLMQACEDLVLDYAYYRDAMDPESFGELFTDDAALTVLGVTYAGKQAIKQRLIDGANAPMTRHMMSTIRIFAETPTRATGVSYVTVYTGTPDNAAPLPQPVTNFAIIGAYHDVFERTENGWRIAQRELKPAFRPAAVAN